MNLMISFAEAISTQENLTYEGSFNNAGDPNNDNTDIYKFTAPRNGNLVITLAKGSVIDNLADNGVLGLARLFKPDGQIISNSSME